MHKWGFSKNKTGKQQKKKQTVTQPSKAKHKIAITRIEDKF